MCSDVLAMGDSILDRVHETLDIALALVQDPGRRVDGLCVLRHRVTRLARQCRYLRDAS